MGDILSTVGVFSTVGGHHDKCGGYLEYRGGYHEYRGGYLEYRGGYSVLWGDIMSTVGGGGVQYHGVEKSFVI